MRISVGVTVIAPAMGKSSDKEITLADFETSDKGIIIACPQGHQPTKTTQKKERHCATFPLETCVNCPCSAQCPAKQGKKYFNVSYKNKDLRLARRRKTEDSDEFKEIYRYRAGAEATMSQLDRKTGIKHLRYRGFDAVRFCVFLKVTGLNILRAAAAWAALKSGQIPTLERLLLLFKELFIAFWNFNKNFWQFFQIRFSKTTSKPNFRKFSTYGRF